MDTDCSYTRQTLQTAVSAAVSAFSEHSGGGSGFHFPSSPWGVINLCSGNQSLKFSFINSFKTLIEFEFDLNEYKLLNDT